MLSSLPLHLLFNSVIFTNLQANDYVVVPTMEDWLSGAKYNTSSFVGFSSGKADAVGALFDPYRPNLTDTSGDLPRYKNVSTELCLSQYNVQYTTLVGNVYIVQSQPTVWRNQTLWKLAVHNITGDFVWYTGSPPNPENYKWQNANTTFPYRSRPETVPSNGWRCPSRRNSTCNVEDEREVPSDKSKWAPYESPVRYCLVEQVPEICKLQFSFIIASVVIVSNLIKAGCIAWLLLRYKKHEALVTLGDAVASFLECVDLTTRGRCLQSKAEVERHFNGNTLARIDHMPDRVLKPQRFEPIRQKWSMAPSYGTWFAAYMFYFGAVLFGILAIIWSLDGMPSGLAKLWKVGFGSVNGKNLLSIGTSLMGSVLLANTPQVILSYLYITFNTLYTNMFIAREWATYLNQRKTLRVTAPIGQQRETYWLSVPFRFAIPMTILSGVFHWLASQSLFMVQITVTVWKSTGRVISVTDSISTCGFSPVAIILTTVIATAIAVGGIIMGRLKYPAGMPMAGSLSAAISAACHPSEEDIDAHLRPVQWGAVSHGLEFSGGNEPVGHCSFSSLPVELPITGRLYA
ncbi:hypothetical protein CC86DRAFT_292029 [Ophiobolus disseminans]|uniref:DUF6536 domain-containing protein n=1 Tax=Ophiobolus disseminans TaxID=1469910 RepID=A0A6A7A3F8_9PLEO|nr:hypothetical protein CC86DRAFT_292029 [Ophiobolus disseminans]